MTDNVALVLFTGEALVDVVDNVIIAQEVVDAVTRNQQVTVVIMPLNTRHIRIRTDELGEGAFDFVIIE